MPSRLLLACFVRRFVVRMRCNRRSALVPAYIHIAYVSNNMVSRAEKQEKMRKASTRGPQATPKVGRPPIAGEKDRDEAAQRSAGKVAAAVAALEEGDLAARVDELVGEPKTRKEEIQQLPTFAEITGLSSEEECKTVLVVPKRSVAAAQECYWDEAATKVEVAACVRRISTRIDELLVEAGDSLSLVEVSPGGRPEVEAQRAGHLKNAANGITKIRVQAEYYEYLRGILEEEFLVLPDDQSKLEEEVFASAEFYPAAVIEQIAAQNSGLQAWARYDRASGTYAYQFAYSSESQRHRAERRGHLVQLGSYDRLMSSRVAKRIQWEEITAYGFTGVGSATDFGKKPIAGAMALSSDLLQMSPAKGIKSGVGAVITIRFPYSTANYHQVLNLLAQAHFKLPIGEHVLEVTLAANPVELAKLLRFKLLAEEVDEVEEKESPRALDLRITEGATAGELIAACAWDMRRAAGREAAAIALARLRRREAAMAEEAREMPSYASQTLDECAAMHALIYSHDEPVASSGDLTYPLQSHENADYQEGGACCCLGSMVYGGAHDIILVLPGAGTGDAPTRSWTAESWLRELVGCDVWAESHGEAEMGASMGYSWARWRPAMHLLGWGFDARGCGGRRK